MKKADEEKTESSEENQYDCDKCHAKTPNQYLVKGKWVCWDCFLKRND